jgi:hypothetical protein
VDTHDMFLPFLRMSSWEVSTNHGKEGYIDE